jgi:uridine kinase
MAPVFIIGVAGGTASGKSTVCKNIINALQKAGEVALVCQDSFYKPLTPEQRANVGSYNFDHPDAMDNDMLLDVINTLKQRRSAEVPVYDFVGHCRLPETTTVRPAEVVIVEGILVLAVEKVRSACHMRVFVETDDDVRLARRIVRDISERGRDVAGVIAQYTQFVKPMFDTFVAPSRREADVIIPWTKGDNHVAIDLIVQHITGTLGQGDLRILYPNLKTIPSNFQVKAMQTIIRDRDVKGHDFVFIVDRLVRLVVEYGLGFLSYKPREVITPTGSKYPGMGFGRGICGVSVIRSGETMEAALRGCCLGVKIGKILITRPTGGAERQVVYSHLPPDIPARTVLLLDPVLASGHTAAKAIDLLLSLGVREENIIFLTIAASHRGIARICGAYKTLTLITSEIDPEIEAQEGCLNNIGRFGDRYFGTEEEAGQPCRRFIAATPTAASSESIGDHETTTGGTAATQQTAATG